MATLADITELQNKINAYNNTLKNRLSSLKLENEKLQGKMGEVIFTNATNERGAVEVDTMLPVNPVPAANNDDVTATQAGFSTDLGFDTIVNITTKEVVQWNGSSWVTPTVTYDDLIKVGRFYHNPVISLFIYIDINLGAVTIAI